MDQYLTTYRKDYPWPSSPPLVRREISLPANIAQRKVVCNCGDLRKALQAKKQSTAEYTPAVGPACRLLDPKTHPAKTGPTPENEATRHNQPDAYMKKLQDKYPNICGVLQSTPTEQVEARVDADRMRTTYQIDFCREDQGPTARTCVTAKSPSDVDSELCRPSPVPTHLRNQDSRTRKSSDASKSKKASKAGKAELDDAQETRIPPWRSEYQDNVGKTGQAIIKYRIHAVKEQAEPVWAMSS